METPCTFIDFGKIGLAMLLGRVNKQNFKVEFKKIFLKVLFCCDVGESDLFFPENYSRVQDCTLKE